MSGRFQDFKYALRALGRSPGFAAAAIATLALGIGATAAVFSVVHGVLWKPLPFREPDRLATVWETDLHNREYYAYASHPDLQDWKRQARSFSHLAAWRRPDMNLTEAGREPERISIAAISHDLFPTLGVAPAIGRGIAPEDDREGGAGDGEAEGLRHRLRPAPGEGHEDRPRHGQEDEQAQQVRVQAHDQRR